MLILQFLVLSLKSKIMRLLHFIIGLCSLFFLSCNNSSNAEKAAVSPPQETTQQPEPVKPKKEMTTISFPSEDGLEITADLFHVAADAPSFVLCHQARFNRTEHTETAKALMNRGYNCLATDQRSGGVLNDQENETAKRAAAKGLGTSYLDALPDIIAAVNFMAAKYNKPVILVGSSYSAALSLKVAKENPNVKAVLSFSPGEYFGDKLNLSKAIKGLAKPTFITSAKNEVPTAQPLVNAVAADAITHFIPKSEGAHGSRVLWSEQPFSAEYWTAVNAFLEQHGL